MKITAQLLASIQDTYVHTFLKASHSIAPLQRREGRIINQESLLYNIYNSSSTVLDSEPTEVSFLALNCGDTTAGQSRSRQDISHQHARYLQTHSADLYLFSDINFSEKLEAALIQKGLGYSYFPCLFQKNIDSSSGFIFAWRGRVKNVYGFFSKDLPQGESARERYLKKLFHPVFFLEIELGGRNILVGSFYVSFYASQRQRLRFQNVLLDYAQSLAGRLSIHEILICGDGNAFGWTVPLVPKYLLPVRFLPIAWQHLVASGFRSAAPNKSNLQEIERLRTQAEQFGFNLYPQEWRPTTARVRSNFGIRFMLDYGYYCGENSLHTEIVEGLYPQEDHQALRYILYF